MSTLNQRAGKGAGAAAAVQEKAEEKRKELQQYKDDDGHFSLVR